MFPVSPFTALLTLNRRKVESRASRNRQRAAPEANEAPILHRARPAASCDLANPVRNRFGNGWIRACNLAHRELADRRSHVLHLRNRTYHRLRRLYAQTCRGAGAGIGDRFCGNCANRHRCSCDREGFERDRSGQRGIEISTGTFGTLREQSLIEYRNSVWLVRGNIGE